MTFFNVCWLVVIFWVLVYVLNTFLLECSFTSVYYARFLSKNGLSIGFLHIKWYIEKCNRFFIKISGLKPNFWRVWFNMGVFLGIFGQIGSLCLLTYTLIDFFRDKHYKDQILVPVLPGVNLPSDHTIYYFIALCLCGIVHEIGHAVAASRELVRVNGFSVFLMFIFPGAYVDLCSDHLFIIEPIRQLRIFCAGIWHNFVLVVLAVICLQLHPYFLAVCFNKGAHVANIVQDSSLVSIIPPNSIITHVGNCHVSDLQTYYECVLKYEKTTNSIGYCMSVNEIKNMAAPYLQSDDDLSECCQLNNKNSNYCFRWNSIKYLKQHYACLPARYVTDKQTCASNEECQFSGSGSEFYCVQPVSDNSTKLIRILYNNGPPVLYVGSVKELIYSIRFEEFVPISKFIPKMLNVPLQLLLKYLIAFSGAIGVLNLVPCFALDGQYILASLLNINSVNTGDSFVDSNIRDHSRHPLLYVIIMFLGTSLLLINILISFMSLAISKLSIYFYKESA